MKTNRCIIFNEKEKCTGCSACVSACPRDCLCMELDEFGNYYPVIDDAKCVGCGIYEKVCPIYSENKLHHPLEGYVARCSDENILFDSNSGGFFTPLANYIIERDGAVYGAAFDENWVLKHHCITQNNSGALEKVRGSKYVQSDLTGIFLDIQKRLQAGCLVCFSGTPCQVAGLRAFLQKEYDNLVCVDLVCHGVAAPLFFQKYIDYMSRKYGRKIKNLKFRNKTYGYHSGTMKIVFEDGKVYYGSGRVDFFLKTYYLGASYRESCYECPYKSIERTGDFTLFDSWHVSSLVENLSDDDRGYTNVYVNTPKAQKIMKNLQRCISYPADVNLMKEYDGKMIDRSFKKHPNRDGVLRESQKNFEMAVRDYLPVSLTDRFFEALKKYIFRFGIVKYISFMRR